MSHASTTTAGNHPLRDELPSEKNPWADDQQRELAEAASADAPVSSDLSRDETSQYLNIASVMLTTLDQQGIIRFINQAGCRLLGYRNPSELLGQNWFDTCIPDTIRSEIQDVFRRLMAGDVESVERYENRILTRYNRERLVVFRNTVLRDTGGTITGVLFSGEDVTDERKIEESLRINEIRSRMLLELHQKINLPLFEIAAFALEQAQELTGSRAGFIASVSDDETMLTYLARSLNTDNHFSGVQTQGAINRDSLEGTLGDAIRERRPFIVNDYETLCHLRGSGQEASAGLTRFVCVPLTSLGKIALLGVMADKETPYTDMDLSQLTRYLDGLWQVVQRNRIETELREERALLAQRVMERTADLTTANQRLTEEIAERERALSSLRESEERYRALVEFQEELICRWTPQTILTFANRAYADALGSSPESVIGRSWLHDLTPPALRPDLVRFVAGLLADPPAVAVRSFVHPFAQADGHTCWYEWNYHPIYDQQGALTEIQSVGRDITRRIELEESLRTSEERWQFAVEGSELGLWDWNIQTNEVYFSPQWKRMLGYDDAEIAHNFKSWSDRVPYSDLEQALHELDRHIAGETALYECEHRIFKKNGDYAWILARGKVMSRAADGTPLRIVGTHKVITERRELETALELSRNRMQSILDNLPMLAWLKDTRGRFLMVNQQFADTVGRVQEEITGLTDQDVWPPDVAAAYQADDESVMLSGTRLQGEQWLAHLRGGAWLETFKTVTVNDQGDVTGTAGIARDITGRKQQEAELLRNQEELNLANDALSRALRLKDEFLACMSHELRTPLTVIIGNAETLADGICGALTPEQTQAVQSIETSGHHLLALINDILDLSKIEAAMLELTPERVSVEALCSASLMFIRQSAHQKRQAVSLTIAPHVTELVADPRRLKQILVNLLNNAVKFTPAGGKIMLEVRDDREHDEIRFSVSDTGIGIPAEALPRLFRPFVQIDSSLTRQYQGTGLGLALVDRLARLHGGSVEVESTVGSGSRFTVTLPWTQHSSVMSVALQPRSVPVGTVPASKSRNIRILLADDNSAALDLISLNLMSRGFQVIIARTGAEAVARVGTDHPHLALMDIQMPGMDGLEAIRRIRALPEPESTLPIIALTALAMSEDRQRCLTAGATLYLSKPVVMKELLAAIETALGHAE